MADKLISTVNRKRAQHSRDGRYEGVTCERRTSGKRQAAKEQNNKRTIEKETLLNAVGGNLRKGL